MKKDIIEESFEKILNSLGNKISKKGTKILQKEFQKHMKNFFLGIQQI